MKRCLFLLSALAVISLGNLGYADPPTIEVKKAEKPPIIDGQLNDACWKQAAMLEIPASAKEPAVKTTCWVAADGRWLYLAFRCQQDKPVLAKRTGHVGNAFYDDSLELSISPDKSGAVSYYFTVAAGGAWFENKVGGITPDSPTDYRGRDPAWRVSWARAVAIGEGGWSAEAAIPLYILGKDTISKEPLGLSIVRNYKGAESPPNRNPMFWPWASPVLRLPWSGLLSGLEGQPIISVCDPVVREAQALRYAIKDGQLGYLVRAKTVNLGGKGGEVGLQYEDSPLGGKPSTITRKISAVANGEQTHELWIVTDIIAQRSARVTIPQREFHDWAIVEGMTKLRPLFSDRNYYTTEKEARIVFEVSAADGTSPQGVSLDLALADPQGRRLFREEKKIGQHSVFVVPMEEWGPGSYQVKATLRDAKGNRLATGEITLSKYPPAPATEVKFDQTNQAILVDGKPFFPVGFMAQNWDEAAAKEMAEGGFNTLVDWQSSGKKLDQLPEFMARLDAAHKYGLKVFEHPWSFGPRLRYSDPDLLEKAEQTLQSMPQSIEAWRKHPAVIGYYGFDEPTTTIEEIAALCRRMYEITHGPDPYHLVYSSRRYYWNVEEYERGFDLFGVHGYWGPGCYGTPNRLACFAHTMNGIHNRPFMATPQDYDMRGWRAMTPTETRCSWYLPVIQGAKGLIMFAYRPHRGYTDFSYGIPQSHPAWWKAATEVAQELRELAPILLTRTPPQKIQSDLMGEPVRVGYNMVSLPVVQALIKNHPQDGEVILVGNSENKPAEVTFTLSSIGKNTKVKGFFDGRDLPVKGNTFSDHLGSYGVRGYRVSNSLRRSPEEPIEMVIKVVRQGEAAPLWDRNRTTATSRNLILNSSFEEATYFGLPDCWYTGGFHPDRDKPFRTYELQQAGDAVHGKYAMRLGYYGERPYVHEGYSLRVGTTNGITIGSNKDHVFSIYLKADREDAKATLCFGKLTGGRGPMTISKSFQVGKQWKRCVLEIPLSKQKLSGRNCRVGITVDSKCLMWADAAQLEVGLTPTDYTPDDYQAPDIGEEYSRQKVLGALGQR